MRDERSHAFRYKERGLQMKKIVIIAGLVLSAAAFARKEDRIVSFQCMARGQTHNGLIEYVQGWQRANTALAKASALSMCSKEGLRGCQVTACYKREM